MKKKDNKETDNDDIEASKADEKEDTAAGVDKSNNVEKKTENSDELIVKRCLIESYKDTNENPTKKLKGSVVDEILRKLNFLDKKVDDIKNKEKCKGAKEETRETEEDLDSIFKKCIIIEELEDVFKYIDIKKEENITEGVDSYYCELCLVGKVHRYLGLSGSSKLKKKETNSLNI